MEPPTDKPETPVVVETPVASTDQDKSDGKPEVQYIYTTANAQDHCLCFSGD